MPEPVAHLTWDQVFAFRMRRQMLDPRTTRNAAEVTRRLCGVQAQVRSAAAFAIGTRRRAPRAGEVDAAIRDRSLVKTWAMRGTLHLLPADDAPHYLASLSRIQPWRSKAWERYHGVPASQVEQVIDAIGEVLGDEPMTREELASAVSAVVRSKAVQEKLGSGWGELLKPAAWAGVLLQGPPREAEVTFVRPDAWVPGWRWPDPDDAGVAVVRTYLGAFGPAAPEHLAGWWARQQPGKVRPWFQRLSEELSVVDVEGLRLWTLTKDVRSLERAGASDAVRLLGNFDQYVLGPASGSAAFIPAAHKADVSRAAGWISKVVLYRGRVAGVWEPGTDSGTIDARLWDDVPKGPLNAEIARVSRASFALS